VIMADVLKILLIILGLQMCIISYWLLIAAIAPTFVERSRLRYNASPWRTLMLGLLVGVPGVILGISLVSTGGGATQFFGFAVLSIVLLAGLFGSGGFASHVGHRMPSPGDQASPWRAPLRGGIVLAIAFVLPIIGWFILLPLTLASGLGNVLLCRRIPGPIAAGDGPISL